MLKISYKIFILLLAGTLGRGKNPCLNEPDCDSCLRKPRCAWCKDPGWEGSRCDLIDSDRTCSFLENPKSSAEILEERPLSGESGSDYVQIYPQRVRVRARIGKEVKLDFKVSQAKEYPVDLYYLMDLSNSMSDDRETLGRLGDKIASAIQSITKDYQIGFGSFVDKEVLPYTSLIPKENCQTPNCPGPYSFKHQMKLSADPFLFRERVRRAPISGNIDQPEGGFDALVQVMVCEEEIGWRNKSRRVIIFTTDTSFHIAMDGKLGGIVTPNDGICHLNSSGFYTHSKILDYPSISHINHLAKENSVNIIWAVTEDQIDLYRSLTESIAGSKIGTISQDSSNIVELIREAYESITTSFKIEEDSSENLKVKFKNRCELGNGKDECFGVELGTPINFRMSIKANGCVPETFSISPIGLDDRLIVEVEPLCECPCSSVGTPDLHFECGSSEICNGRGHLVCGECSCCPGYVGRRCECETTGTDLDDEELFCRSANASNRAPQCSGRGECHCGVCKCHQPRPGVVVSGRFCENVCDNTACVRNENGDLCSGHGQCVCGECICDPSWTEEDCSCHQGNPEACIRVAGEAPCSGFGICPCDKCICTAEGHYGEYCQYCDTCRSTCSKLRTCVECLAFHARNEQRNDCSNVCKNDPEGENVAVKYDEWFREDIPLHYENCTFTFRDCEYSFSYLEEKEKLEDVVLPPNTILRSYYYVLFHLTDPNTRGETDTPKLKCPVGPNIWGLVLGIIGAVVFIGLATLILWKVFTTISDRREFVKFETERQRVKLPAHSNPIFRQATTTVQNPLFNPTKFG